MITYVYCNNNEYYVADCFRLQEGTKWQYDNFSLRGEAWANKIILTPPHFIEVPVPSQESECPCICVLGLSISALYSILIYICICFFNGVQLSVEG